MLRKSGLFRMMFLFSVSLSLLSCGEKGKEDVERIPYVKVESVDDAVSARILEYPGKTRPSDEVNVSFRVSGPIVSMRVNEGDYVKKGQLIAEMDQRDYNLQLKAVEAEYQSVKAEAERIIAMYQEGSTTANNYDKARFGLQQITEKLNNARNQINDTRLVAPISGYISSKFHEAGETVAQGMPIVSIYSGSSVEVEINLSSNDFAKRSNFLSYSCSFDVLPGKTFPLSVASINNEANSNQLYKVRLRFNGPVDNNITPGMTTMVKIERAVEEGTIITIPKEALLEKDGKVSVFLYDSKAGKVNLREITVSRLTSKGKAIVIRGLEGNEQIVTAGVHKLTNGQRVKPLPTASKSNVGGLL